MKIRLLKPSLIELTKYPKDAVVDCDDSRAEYLIEQGQAVEASEASEQAQGPAPEASHTPAETGE